MAEPNKCIWCGGGKGISFGVCESCRRMARRHIKIYKQPRPRMKPSERKKRKRRKKK